DFSHSVSYHCHFAPRRWPAGRPSQGRRGGLPEGRRLERRRTALRIEMPRRRRFEKLVSGASYSTPFLSPLPFPPSSVPPLFPPFLAHFIFRRIYLYPVHRSLSGRCGNPMLQVWQPISTSNATQNVESCLPVPRYTL